MPTTPPPPQDGRRPQPASDAALIAAVRRGEHAAFEDLVGRHRAAGGRLARRLCAPAADQLLEEAVEAVSGSLRSGTGPTAAFRPYLLTAVRRSNYARARRSGRVRPIDDLGQGRAVPVAGVDLPAEVLAVAADAYRDLPETSQIALWHTEVEGEPMLDTGRLLGVAGTDVAELAFSARDSLRAAQLAGHLRRTTFGPCRWVTERLGAHARSRLPARDAAKVAEHLQSCTGCAAVFPAVVAVEKHLRVIVATVVLGSAAGPYLGREVAAAAGRGRHVLAAGGRSRVTAVTGSPRSTALIAAGLMLIAGGFVATMTYAGSGDGSADAVAEPPAVSTLEPVEERDEPPPTPTLDGETASGSGSTGQRTPDVPDVIPAIDSTTGSGPADRSGSGSDRTDGEPAAGRSERTGDARERTPATLPEDRPDATTRSAPTVEPEAEQPESTTSSEDVEEDAAATRLGLGVAEVAITPGAGPLGLPKISLTPPDGATD